VCWRIVRSADLDHEHHRVADLHPRVELREAVDHRPAHDAAMQQRGGAPLDTRGWLGALW
jgi:hypothetical protein